MGESSDHSSLQKNKAYKQDPNNFQPISVIGHISKLFEKLVGSQLR